MDPVVADGLTKSYGATQALRGISLSLAAGEIVALVGPNGAGKTTLVRCLTGTTSPDAGDVTLLGSPPRAVDRSRIGLLPQDFDPPDRLTARELLAYYAGLYDGTRPVESVLREVGMADDGDVRYARLSGGQKRRVSVGTAIVNDPAVLILDEPTTGIDPAGRRAVWSRIEAFADRGSTVLLTTHSLAEAERLADRVGIVLDGRLLALDTPARLTAEYGGRPRVVVATGDEVAFDGYVTERSDRGLVIHDVAADEIGDVIADLEAANVTYDAVTWREPGLETVYFALAGDPERPEVDAR